MVRWKGGILMRDNRIRRVMDESLSHMAFTNAQKQKVLAEIKGEKIVKRKISTALVFALVIMLAAGVALAVMSLRDAGRQIVETEQTDGTYKNWPIEKRVSLARALIELGYAEKTQDAIDLLAGKVSEQDAGRIADAVLMAFTGKEITEISFMEIMQAALGPFDKWTKEEQAWHSQLMVDMGLQGSDHTLYVLPTGPVDEAEAVSIARREIASAFGVSEAVFDGYALATSFQVPEFAEPDDTQAYWYVEFMPLESTQGADKPFYTTWVFVHPETGELLISAEEIAAEHRASEERRIAMDSDPLYQEMGRFYQEKGFGENAWSLEDKAEWSRLFAPEIRKRMQAEEPEHFDYTVGGMAMHDYGLPDEKSISQEEAFAIATQEIVDSLGRAEAEIPFYTHKYNVYYDVANPERPLWKFFFFMPNEYDMDEAYAKQVIDYYGEDGERLPNLKVELDAYTGEVVQAFEFDYADVNSVEANARSM